MNLAEKVLRAKADYDAVYEAGKAAGGGVVDPDPIPVTATGNRFVSVNDVSEIPHNVSVQLSSDTITDFSGVTVTRVGKNLFNKYNLLSVTTDYRYRSGLLEDGTIYVPSNAMSSDITLKELAPGLKVGETYTLTATSTGDYKYIWLKQAATTWTFGKTLTIAESHLNSVVYFYTFGGDKTRESAIVTDMQIEAGADATRYEPYSSEQFGANQNGTVYGVTSLPLNMTLFTDADVSLTVGYNRSKGVEAGEQAHKQFWSAYCNPERNDFDNLFAGQQWNNKTFTPPAVTLKPKRALAMFSRSGLSGDFVENCNNFGFSIDFSECAYISNMFANANGLTRLGVFDFTGAVSGTTTVFISAVNLKTIDKIIVGENTKEYTNWFNGCSKLESVTIEGVICKNSFNTQWCPLNRASIESIMAALSTTTTGLTVTFKKTAVEAAFTTEEWAALCATRSNWTIAKA